jgi:anti-anti-sigma factor
MPCQLQFPVRADMHCVAALREQWLAQMETHTYAEVNCAQVEVMTAAGAQLVVALAKRLEAVGGSVVLVQASPALAEDFSLLGLTEFLQELPHHV